MTAVSRQLQIPQPNGPAYGETLRIGLIALSTDLAVERDFGRMADDEVSVFTTRVQLRTPNSEATFLELERQLPAASALLIPSSRLDVIAFGCTAAAMLIGNGRLHEAISAGRPGVKTTNPAIAVTTAFGAVGARRVAVLTPYTPSVTKKTVDYLEAQGLEVVDAAGLGFDMDDTHARISEDTLMDAAMTLNRSRADALFVSCTAIRAINIIGHLEAETGLPVVTSNQATFWHAMHLCGVTRGLPGFGRLLGPPTAVTKSAGGIR